MKSIKTEETTPFALKKQGASAFSAFSNSNIPPQLNPDKVDVILIFLPKNDKEYIPNVPIKRTGDGDIMISQLISYLKGVGFPLDKNIVSYYRPSNDMFVYSGIDPVPPGAVIPGDEVIKNGETKQVTLRIRQATGSSGGAEVGGAISGEILGDRMKFENVKQEGSMVPEQHQNSDDGMQPKQKRTKERKIGEILEKVLQWRRLYNGTTDAKTGQVVKMSLEEAAQKVGISKKSLDDYLLQIRFGKKHGFSFNDHINDRVGVLRSFVKKHKTSKKAEKTAEDDHFDLPNEFEGLIQSEGNEKSGGLSKKSKKI